MSAPVALNNQGFDRLVDGYVTAMTEASAVVGTANAFKAMFTALMIAALKSGNFKTFMEYVDGHRRDWDASGHDLKIYTAILESQSAVKS